MTKITVRDAVTLEALPGIPTPRLIQEGSGEAYFVPNTDLDFHLPGIWYLRERDYVSPNGEYRRVRVTSEET